jgi:hypothetical protein
MSTGDFSFLHFAVVGHVVHGILGLLPFLLSWVFLSPPIYISFSFLRSSHLPLLFGEGDQFFMPHYQWFGFLVTYGPNRSPFSLLLCSFFSCELIAIPWDPCNVLVCWHCYCIGTLSLFACFVFGPVLGLLNNGMVAVFFTPLMLIYFVVLVALFMFKGHTPSVHKKESFSLPKKSTMFKFDQIYLIKF